MITNISLHRFKNFGDARLSLGPFTVVVGTNASGKSNLRDMFRFLHGVGRGYTLAEIIGGRYGPGGQPEWAPMRGAANEIVQFQQDSFSVDVGFNTALVARGHYHIEIAKPNQSGEGFRVVTESLSVHEQPVYTSHPGDGDAVALQEDQGSLALRLAKVEKQKRLGSKVLARPDRPALSQLAGFSTAARIHKDWAQELLDLFAGIRFLDLVPELMRKPSFPGQTILGDSGENLPSVLQSLCADPNRKLVLTDWIRELTPLDVADLEFPRDPITGLVQLSLREGNGNSVSAYSASDGTLRFLAMLAALLGSHPARLYFLEEIDNGIHPSRLKLLIDLIEGQTGKGGVQVVTTTHSPDLLSIISDKTFAATSVVFRLPHAPGALIKRVVDLPHAAELRASQGLGRLHASGWMEDMLFLEDEPADAA